MQQTVHVTVQMATVGLLAEVTKLHVGDIKLRNILRRCLSSEIVIYICSVSSCRQTLQCTCIRMHMDMISHVSTIGMTM